MAQHPVSLHPNFKCVFCYMAPAELCFSLHVLANPAEYPIYSDWARRKYDSLSSNLRYEINYFNTHCHWHFITNTVVYLLSDEDTNIDDLGILLTKLKKMDNARFFYLFLGTATHFPLSSYQGLFERWLREPDLVDLREIKPYGEYFRQADVVEFFRNPDAIKQRLITLFQQYWAETFHREWNHLREYEDNEIRYQCLRYQNNDPLHYISTLHKDLVIEGNQVVFKKKKPPFMIEVSKLEKLVIKPSVFIGEMLAGNIVNENKMTVTLNLNFHAVKIYKPAPPQLTDIISALDDKTRLRIIKVLWNCDATTKELAQITGVSPSTVSIHLKMLSNMELVVTRRIGKFVYYQIRRDRFYGLEKRLIRYLSY